MIQLNYALNKDDYANYYTYVKWDAPENKKKRLTYHARQLLPIVAFTLAFYYTGLFKRDTTFILLIGGFILLTSIMAIFGVRTNLRKQAEKFTEDPKNAILFTDTQMQVSETGIQCKSEWVSTQYQWKAFIRLQENDKYFFLFISSAEALIIPKRAFSHTEKTQSFEKSLRQHLSFDAEIGHLVKS
jgi:hypothetical protein